MRRDHVVVSIFLLVLCSVSNAALLFKMEAPKTSLLPGETVTVTVSAWAQDAAVSSTNGLNYWAFSALVDRTGVAEVIDGSFTLLGPMPISFFSLNKNSVNQAVSGGTGSIDYLNAYPSGVPLPTDTGLGYDPIVSFVVRATGSVGDSVTYTLGDTNGFLGILADGSTILDGVFDAGSSQNVFTIVPEPSSLLILSVLGVFSSLSRKR